MDKLIAEQTNYGADENGLAVVAVAEQDHDAGDVAARLDGIADEFVPMPPHGFGVFGATKDFADGPVVLRTRSVWVVCDLQAMPQVLLRPVRP